MVKELKTKDNIKYKNMGRSYNLKKSPINKGTAAKPSPMKEPISLLASLLIAGATSAIGAGSSAIQGSKNRKAAQKAQKEQEAANASQSAIAGIGKNLGKGKTRIA